MLRYVYGDELGRHKRLAQMMFEDRADQFARRLGWEVSVDEAGQERDDYDRLNPLYVIWETPEGAHAGSMRFLPTTGPVMVNDHFAHLLTGPVVSPLIWECTRFCLARGAGAHVAAGLMLGGGEIMRGFGIAHFVGVFDARMERIYRMIGAAPEVIGSAGVGRERVSVGLWGYDEGAQARVARQAGIDPAQSQFWFEQAMGQPGACGQVKSA